MFISKLISLSVLLTFFIAINGDDSSSVENVFKLHEVVTDVVPTAPKQFLKITYKNGIVAYKGNELTPTQVQSPPQVVWDALPNTFYTLAMVDPDAPSRTDPKYREFNHWLVVNIPGHDIAKGDEIVAYIGSGPPLGTGLHRYVFLLYKQPSKLKFDEPRVSNTSRANRPKFSIANFARKYNLEDPLAGAFFQAQWDDYVPILHKQLKA